MAKAKEGDKVKVHYKGTLDSGEVFYDSHQEKEPLEFTLGADEVIPGFDKAIIGMAAGESKNVKIEADDAYGPHRDDLLAQVRKSTLPDDIQCKVGETLAVEAEGERILVTIREIKDEHVILDGNHPLAGQHLTYDIELLEIDGKK